MAQRLAQAMEKETNPSLLEPLAFAFAAVAQHAPPAQVSNYFRLFSATLRDQSNSRVLSAWAQAIANLPDPLDTSDLVNVLKYPNCTGELRSAVLARLAKNIPLRWNPTENPWPIITHPKLEPYVHQPLVAPPDWPAR